MNLLALDLSTTVLGYSIFNMEDKSLMDMGYHTFESDDMVDKGAELHKFLLAMRKERDLAAFAIEERLKSFRSGGTNADAMLKTAQMNFLCQYLMKHELMLETIEINVNTARSTCFPGFHTIARARKGTKHKEIAFEMVCKALGEGRFPKKVLKSGPRKGQEVFLDEAGDMADSWVIGQAALNPKPVKEKKTKK